MMVINTKPLYQICVLFQAYFDEHQVPAGERAIKQAIENIHLNYGWLEREKDNIEKWLTENQCTIRQFSIHSLLILEQLIILKLQLGLYLTKLDAESEPLLQFTGGNR